MGVFIRIELDHERLTRDMGQHLTQLCPVNIFRLADDRVCVEDAQVDECTLCELCLDAAPAGALRIKKTYKNETLVSRGGGVP